MSKYLLDKFLFTVDRDPALVERYREDPRGTVEWWEAEEANRILNAVSDERSTWLAFEDEEREALATHDHVRLFELGAHPFLTLTLFIAMFDEVDEATAIMPVVPRQSELPPGTRLIALDQDGCDLPADWYLRVTGSLAGYLRAGQVPPESLSQVLRP